MTPSGSSGPANKTADGRELSTQEAENVNNNGRGDMPKEPRCPLCKGSGVLVCNAAGEPGHDHRFLKDTTEYWCPTCNGIGRIKKGGA